MSDRMSGGMDDERVDLSPIDLASEPERLEALVRRVMAAAGPELARRAAARDPILMLRDWARPVLATAAVVSALALGALAWERAGDGVSPFVSVAEALEIAGPAYEWLTDDRDPTAADMIVFVEGYWP